MPKTSGAGTATSGVAAHADVAATADVATRAEPAASQVCIDTADLEALVAALTGLRDGQFSARVPARGPLAMVAERFNEVAARHDQRTRDLVRISRVIGREGRMTERLD
ncbi:MAG: hypothetical protein QOK14_81, partial [Frankiaceae bacterium]|nr:hypothetical protein [Frankiaceae bacterium]